MYRRLTLVFSFKMDWLSEANSIVDDVKPFVKSIQILQDKQPPNLGIYLDIEILEQRKLVVLMDTRGFTVCKPISSETDSKGGDEPELQTYETIYALLFNNSIKYSQTFADSLYRKISSLGDFDNGTS